MLIRDEGDHHIMDWGDSEDAAARATVAEASR